MRMTRKNPCFLAYPEETWAGNPARGIFPPGLKCSCMILMSRTKSAPVGLASSRGSVKKPRNSWTSCRPGCGVIRHIRPNTPAGVRRCRKTTGLRVQDCPGSAAGSFPRSICSPGWSPYSAWKGSLTIWRLPAGKRLSRLGVGCPGDPFAGAIGRGGSWSRCDPCGKEFRRHKLGG